MEGVKEKFTIRITDGGMAILSGGGKEFALYSG